MENKFSIGEVSSMFKVSIHTLRYYDKIGLLKPSVNENNKYRYYEPKHIHQLSIILGARYLEIPIDKIKDIFASDDIDKYYKLISEQEDMIDKKIADLKKLKINIRKSKAKIDGIKSHENKYDFNEIEVLRGEKIIYELNNKKLKNYDFKRFMSSVEFDGFRSEYYYKCKSKEEKLEIPLDNIYVFKGEDNKEVVDILEENLDVSKKEIIRGNFVYIDFLGSLKEVREYISLLPSLWVHGDESAIFVNERSYLPSNIKAEYYFRIVLFFK